MDTMTYASVAALPENVANSTRRLQVPEVELTPLDLSYLGKSIRAELSRLKEQLTELKDDLCRLTGLLKYLGKNRPPTLGAPLTLGLRTGQNGPRRSSGAAA